MATRFLPLARVAYRSFASHAGPSKGDRVVVAMSGGVDSSVAAKLLANGDYNLSAIYMRNWDTRDESGTDYGCEWEKDWEDVQRVCRMLDLPCKMLDLSREYWNRVFEPSLKSWESGQTPNPDVWCNREVKFGALLDHLSDTSTSSWLATGHYARKAWSHDPLFRPMLIRARDKHKDQTFFLSSISEQSLKRALFPLGNLTKLEVRQLALKYQLPTAQRAESMGICFVGKKRKFKDFISQYIEPNPGPIVDLTTGQRIGTHQGMWTYTIGQGAKLGGLPYKPFVARKDLLINTIYVVPGTHHKALYCNGVSVRDWTWIWADSPPPEINSPDGFRARMKFRHVMDHVLCTVKRSNDDMIITFDELQKAEAPGQIAVIWDGDWCLGCGTIKDVLFNDD